MRCKIRPRSWWTERRAGLGLMSTQRRVDRATPTIKVDRVDVWPGITAPLMSIIWLAWAWLRSCDEGSQASTFRVATNSLYPDHCIETFAGFGSLSGSPPRAGAGCRRLPVQQATHRPSLPHIPFLPVRTHLHPTLPQAPAGEVRWAERHDGKRDLYFQHAA
jgi:hypothetical protein